MAKKPYKDPENVPVDYIFTPGVGKNIYAERLSKFITKNNIVGNLTWKKLRELDPKFADEIEKLVSENKKIISEKYTEFGGNIKKMETRRKTLKSKKKKTYKVKTLKEKTENAKTLLNKDLSKLGIQELKQIIFYGGLEFEKLKPYYERIEFLKKNPKNYVKPNRVNAAKGLLTFNFGKKANPMKWIDNDNNEIILSKLYSAKMGIQYLEKNNTKALEETLKIVKPKLDEVLKSLEYKDINEIEF